MSTFPESGTLDVSALSSAQSVLQSSCDIESFGVRGRQGLRRSETLSERSQYLEPNFYDNPKRQRSRSLGSISLDLLNQFQWSDTVKINIDPNSKVQASVNLIADRIEATGHVTVTGNLGAHTPKKLAQQLFHENTVPVEQISRILCRNDPYHLIVCKEYMNNFNFTGLQIDEALRMLMKKLILIGETHSVERLLQCFSARYHACNPDNHQISVDAYQIITCSLMILNSDLYILPKKQKMKEKQYIQNVIDCFGADDPKPSTQMLKNLYRSIKNERLPVHDFEKQSAKPEVAKKKFPEEEPKPVVDDSFEINKSSPLYYIIYSAPKSRKFLSIFRFKYSWSLAHVSLAGLKLIIHSKKKDTLKDSITLNIAHSYAEYMVTDSTVKYKFLLYLQNGVVAKFYDTKHENCVDWVMHINASSAMLSSPHSSYTFGNPPIFRKSRTYPTEPYKGKIVDLLNIWTLRLSEISYILKKSLEYKSNNVSKKVMDLSIKATQKEKSRMLRYINTIRSYDHQFLSMYLHKDNPNGMDGLKEKLESLNSDFVDPLM